MKNLQAWFLKIIITFPFLLYCLSVNAQTQRIAKADSLFRAKQYTQSLELYQAAFNEQKYSPAMLLKMAYIQEGLGKIGPTLYYLKLYNLASNDEQALNKMEELAAKFKLSGYAEKDADRFQRWINKNRMLIQAAVAGILSIAAFSFFVQRKQHQKPWASAVAILLFSALIFYLNNFYSSNPVIVGNDHAYLMEGPSAGAPVVVLLAEGNLLESTGQEDVWLKVKWMNKIVYVKKNSVMTVAL